MFHSTPFFVASYVGMSFNNAYKGYGHFHGDISVEKSTMFKDLNGINHKRKNKEPNRIRNESLEKKDPILV